MLVSCHGVELSDAFLSVSKAISNKVSNFRGNQNNC